MKKVIIPSLAGLLVASILASVFFLIQVFFYWLTEKLFHQGEWWQLSLGYALHLLNFAVIAVVFFVFFSSLLINWEKYFRQQQYRFLSMVITNFLLIVVNLGILCYIWLPN